MDTSTGTAMGDLKSRDPRKLPARLCPDFDRWLCASPEARALGCEVYGF